MLDMHSEQASTSFAGATLKVRKPPINPLGSHIVTGGGLIQALFPLVIFVKKEIRENFR